MEKKQFVPWLGKLVYLECYDSRGYKARIVAVDDDSVTFIDKYGLRTIVGIDSVRLCRDWREGSGSR